MVLLERRILGRNFFWEKDADLIGRFYPPLRGVLIVVKYVYINRISSSWVSESLSWFIFMRLSEMV